MDDDTKVRTQERGDGVAAPVPGAGRAGTAPLVDTGLATGLGELERAGWAGQVVPLEGGSIRCLTCRQEFGADEVDADDVRRLEGASDPADMVIVVPVVCPRCSTKGVLVAHFGAEASGEEADVVAALSRTPAHGRGTHLPPGETA